MANRAHPPSDTQHHLLVRTTGRRRRLLIALRAMLGAEAMQAADLTTSQDWGSTTARMLGQLTEMVTIRIPERRCGLLREVSQNRDPGNLGVLQGSSTLKFTEEQREHTLKAEHPASLADHAPSHATRSLPSSS